MNDHRIFLKEKLAIYIPLLTCNKRLFTTFLLVIDRTEKKDIPATQRYVPSRVSENFGEFQGCKSCP